MEDLRAFRSPEALARVLPRSRSLGLNLEGQILGMSGDAPAGAIGFKRRSCRSRNPRLRSGFKVRQLHRFSQYPGRRDVWAMACTSTDPSAMA